MPATLNRSYKLDKHKCTRCEDGQEIPIINFYRAYAYTDKQLEEILALVNNKNKSIASILNGIYLHKGAIGTGFGTSER